MGEPPGLFVVQLIIVKCSFANSILGPWVILTSAAFGVVRLSWADRLPPKIEIANSPTALFMFKTSKNSLRLVPLTLRFSVWCYGIGRLGRGGTLQIADAQGG